MSFEGNVPGAGGSGESAAYVTDGVVHVLNSDAVFKGDYANDSQDLVITAPDGSSVRVIDYFTFAFPPDVQAPNGSIVRGKDVVRLSGAAEDTRLAQAQDGGAQADGDLSLANAIGQVESFNGVARVTRADGTTVTLGNGDLVFQNDVVETASESSLSLTFVDGTIFSLSAGSRMVLDELVFDPGGSDNSAVFSLIEGGFVFIAGQVAPTGGMNVNTPSGVIGIRGTTVEVQILTVGGVAEVLVSLLLDPDGSLGEIELFDNSGTLVGTITDTETSWVLSTVDGETREITRAEANQLSEQALQSLVAQTFSAFGVATARVSAGGTFVSQDRVFGGGDPDDEEGLDADTLQDENAVPEDNGSDGNFEGDDGEGAPTDDAPAQDGEAVDENAAPEDSDASGAEDGETQDDSETQPDTEQPAIEEGSLQQEQENTLAAAGTGGVGGEAIPVAQSNAQSTGDAASDADGVFETGQLDPDKLEDAPLQNTVEDVQLDGSGVIQTGESTQLADGDANADGGLGSLGLAEGGEIVVGQSAGTVDESEPVQQQANVAPASLSFASSEPDPFGAGGTDPEDAFGFEGGAELGADPGLGGTSFGGDPQRTSFDAGEPELASAEPAQQSAQVFAQTFQDNDNDPAPEPAALPEQADPAPQPDPEPEPDIPVDPDPEPSEPPVLFDASFAFFADRLDRSGSVQADDAAGTPLTFSLLAGP
ncbi:MAG: FecR domain-containing protein, partial [Pseudomonadota bacterium]